MVTPTIKREAVLAARSEYGRSDPINRIDPSGLDWRCFKKRFRRNFGETNDALWGLLAPFPLGTITGGAVGQALGLPTVGTFLTSAGQGALATGGLAAEVGGGLGAVFGAGAVNISQQDISPGEWGGQVQVEVGPAFGAVGYGGGAPFGEVGAGWGLPASFGLSGTGYYTW